MDRSVSKINVTMSKITVIERNTGQQLTGEMVDRGVTTTGKLTGI